MPYLDRDIRYYVDKHGSSVAGELNYELTQVIIGYMNRNGILSYQLCNDIVGALDNCKDEFRRRVQHPYEDEKIKENGDIYEYEKGL